MKIIIIITLLLLFFVACSRDKNPINIDLDIPKITWKSMNLELSSISLYPHKIGINSQNDIFVATNEAILHRLLYNDTTWITVKYFGGNISRTFIYINHKNEIYIGDRGWAPVLGGGVDQSKDNGESWTSFFYVGQGVNCLTMNEDGHYYLGCSSVFWSINDGESWDEITNGLPNDGIISITYDDIHKVLFIGTENEGIYRLPNNKDSCEYVGLERNRIFALSCNYITGSTFAGTGMGIFRTRDQGISWKNVNVDLSTAWIMCVTITDEGYVLMGTEENGAFLSTNDGEEWHNIGLTNQRVYGIDIDNNKYIYAVTDSNRVVRSEQKLIIK